MAYSNKLINDGPYGSYMADPNSAAIGIYRRCKFVPSGGVTSDDTPILQLASATERADVVTMQPIAAGAYGTVKFMNGGGEQFGQLKAGDGGVANGTALYAASSGQVSPSSAGGALLIAMTTMTGADGGIVTYTRNMPAA